MGSGLPQSDRAGWHCPLVAFHHTRMPQVDPNVGSPAPAGGAVEGALGVPKDDQGAGPVLSGAIYMNSLCAPKSALDS